MSIIICYVVSISVLKEINLLNHIYFKSANSIKYRDLMNTENKAQLKDLCKFIQIIISKVSQTQNAFTQFQVHHYYRKDQALYFVSARYGPWEVLKFCTLCKLVWCQ